MVNHEMNVTRILLGSILGGVAITLLTGLTINTPPMLVGAVHYGYPFAWLIRMIVTPQYFPWTVNVSNLILDLIVWSLAAGVALFLLKRK